MSKINTGIIREQIVVLALTFKLKLNNVKSKIILFDKENKVGSHQSGRNCGVLHYALFYKKGSLIAKFAKSVIEKNTDFYVKHQIHILNPPLLGAKDSLAIAD